MHVRVVELMVAGVRRPREECLADPGTIGTLSIGDIPIGTAEKRPLHAAQLWERWGTSARRGLLPPLLGLYAGIPEISVSPAPVPPRAHPGR